MDGSRCGEQCSDPDRNHFCHIWLVGIFPNPYDRTSAAVRLSTLHTVTKIGFCRFQILIVFRLQVFELSPVRGFPIHISVGRMPQNHSRRRRWCFKLIIPSEYTIRNGSIFDQSIPKIIIRFPLCLQRRNCMIGNGGPFQNGKTSGAYESLR